MTLAKFDTTDPEGGERTAGKFVNINYPWQRNYLEAVLETDNSKMLERIAAAESTIKARTTELEQDHHGTPEERLAIADALHALGILRRERIND